MDENGEIDRPEVMLPGFRFHPTDEELVGFYLKKKVEQNPLAIQLIRPLDIYKYEPWDLPKLAITGEKEWCFYCQRNRKYRNSPRPNRVTGAGFWKATGTDRPIFSSAGTRCIGLKKSLVFYRGRAAKGIKTDWMMHELRLPSLSDSSSPANSDSWTICRIFKKTNSMAQKAPPEITGVSRLSLESRTSMNQTDKHPPAEISVTTESLSDVAASSWLHDNISPMIFTDGVRGGEDLPPMEVIWNLGGGGEEIGMKEMHMPPGLSDEWFCQDLETRAELPPT